jgi:hypothetical protein
MPDLHPTANAPTFESSVEEVDNQPAKVSWHGKEHQYNLAQILSFKDDLEEATATHAQKQSYWEQMAIEVASKVTEFEEIGKAKWEAHARRYTRLVMHILQVKETLESLKDWMITIYTEDLSVTDRDTFAHAAYKGSLLERLGTIGKVEAYLTKNEFPNEIDNFAQTMFSYWEAGWTYERVVKTHRSLKEQRDKLQAFAKTMNERSFQIKQYKDMVVAKHGNNNPFPQDAMGRSKEATTVGDTKKPRQYNMPKTAE